MQAFVKRGYQGSLKASSDKMGEQFSASGTTIKEESTMEDPQDIITEVGTTTAMMNQFAMPEGVPTAQGTLDQGTPVYSLNTRTSGNVVSETKQRTDSAAEEKARKDELPESASVSDFLLSEADSD
jgi:hypothetical protein